MFWHSLTHSLTDTQLRIGLSVAQPVRKIAAAALITETERAVTKAERRDLGG